MRITISRTFPTNRCEPIRTTSEPTQNCTYAGTGYNPKLGQIAPAPGWGTGSWIRSYDQAGNQTSILESNDEGAVQTTLYDIAADGRMNALRTDIGPSRTDFLYDGRGYLRQGLLTVTGSTDNLRATPTYSSEGTLMARTEVRQYTGSTIGPDGEDQVSAQMSNETTQLFYFAGRPVAQLTSGPELLYLTTDHLGTPVLATDTSGGAVWAGGVEPFGQTWTAGIDNPDPELAAGGSGPIGQGTAPALGTLASEKVFLRYPGQWVSDLFRVTGTQQETYYNVNRWYEAGAGMYTQPDPLGFTEGDPHPYTYVMANPNRGVDPQGLRTFIIGAGKFRFGDNCKCALPVKILGEDKPSFVNNPVPGGFVEADAVYTTGGILKIPDNYSCTFTCDDKGQPTSSDVLETIKCSARPWIPGKEPQLFPPGSNPPRGWPPNPLTGAR